MNAALTAHLLPVVAVAVPLLWFVGRRVGLGLSLVVGFAVAVFDDEVVPHFPGSPIACVLSSHANPCVGRQIDWLMALTFVVPLLAGLLYKETH